MRPGRPSTSSLEGSEVYKSGVTPSIKAMRRQLSVSSNKVTRASTQCTHVQAGNDRTDPRIPVPDNGDRFFAPGSRHRRTQVPGDTVEKASCPPSFGRLLRRPCGTGQITTRSQRTEPTDASRLLPSFPALATLWLAGPLPESPGLDPSALLVPDLQAQPSHRQTLSRAADLPFLRLVPLRLRGGIRPHPESSAPPLRSFRRPPSPTLRLTSARPFGDFRPGLLRGGETGFPHFQQKSCCMRVSGSIFLHLFHSCGHLCG